MARRWRHGSPSSAAQPALAPHDAAQPSSLPGGAAQPDLETASRLHRWAAFAAACDMLNDEQLSIGMLHELSHRPGVKSRLAVLFQYNQQRMDATASAISSEVEEVVCDEAAKAQKTEAERDAHWNAVVEMLKAEEAIQSIPSFEQEGKVLLGGLSDAQLHLQKEPCAHEAAAALTALNRAWVGAQPLPQKAHDTFNVAIHRARELVVWRCVRPEAPCDVDFLKAALTNAFGGALDCQTRAQLLLAHWKVFFEPLKEAGEDVRKKSVRRRKNKKTAAEPVAEYDQKAAEVDEAESAAKAAIE